MDFIIEITTLDKLMGCWVRTRAHMHWTLPLPLPVDDDWPLELPLVVHILQVESDWELEIELHSGALEFALQGIKDSDIDLGTIECTVAQVHLQQQQPIGKQRSCILSLPMYINGCIDALTG
jgi:hypothetical protein